MKVLIVSNGSIGDPEALCAKLPPVDYVISSDGGTRHLNDLGLMPDLILGDFDSVDPDLLKTYEAQGVLLKRYPMDKDRTDTHIAVDTAAEMGAKEVILTGVLGTRFDHSYANVLLLVRLARRNIRGVIIDNHNTIYVSDTHISIQGTPGGYLSLLPLTTDTVISAASGLQYPLENAPLPLNNPLGVSNVLIEPKAEVSITSGWLMAVLAQD